MKRKIFIGTLFILSNFLILLLVFFVFYKFYIKELKIELPIIQNDTGLDDREFKLLQNQVHILHTGKKSNFKNFSKNKSENTIRIGCFGDSYTYGSEVNNVLDYPSQLQKIYKENGFSNVEVINFGMSWHGFFQQYLVWDIVGRHYNLDYILLGPTTFWHDRDFTFNHTYSFNYLAGVPSYIHSRYILKNGQAILLEVPGANIIEKTKDYWSFIPRYRYIRYDTELPVIFRSVLAILLPNKKIAINPFYYHKNDYKSELNEIYSILISNMAETVKSVVVGYYSYFDHIKSIEKAVKVNNVNVNKVSVPATFPYHALGGHHSPMGYGLLAQQYFNMIMSNKMDNMEHLVLDNIEFQSMNKYLDVQQDLNDFDSVDVEIANQDVARFYDRTIGYWQQQCYEQECNSHQIFRNVKSLIALFNDNLLESLYLPLKETNLNNQIELYLVIKQKDKNITKNIGRIKLIHPQLPIAYMKIGEYEYDRYQTSPLSKASIRFQNLYDITSMDIKNINSITIQLDKIIILSSNNFFDIKNQIFYPHNRGLFTIHFQGDKLLEVSKLRNKEIINLGLLFKSRKIKIPIGTLSKSSNNYAN